MLFRHYFYFTFTRFARKSNLINTCNRSPLGPLQSLGVNSGAPTLLILSTCKPFSLLTTSFLFTDTMIAIKISFILRMKGQMYRCSWGRVSGWWSPSVRSTTNRQGPLILSVKGEFAELSRESENLQEGKESKEEARNKASPPLLCFPTMDQVFP